MVLFIHVKKFGSGGGRGEVGSFVNFGQHVNDDRFLGKLLRITGGLLAWLFINRANGL